MQRGFRWFRSSLTRFNKRLGMTSPSLDDGDSTTTISLLAGGQPQPPAKRKSKWEQLEDEEDERPQPQRKLQRIIPVSTPTLTPTRVKSIIPSKTTTRRIRDQHPPLESCRSVYCYEVSPSLPPFPRSYAIHSANNGVL